MEKTDLIMLARNLMLETLYARSYKDILDQYIENRRKYKTEMGQSPTFYSISELALFEALSIRIARLYDKDDKSANLSFLMEQAENHVDYFPKSSGELVTESEGEEYRIVIPLRHTLRECEKCYFKEKVEQQKAAASVFGTPGKEITIDVSIHELLDMYHKRFTSLGAVKKNLTTQRNKIFAHNDKDLNFDLDAIYKSAPLFRDDIEKMLEFAEDYTVFCYESLSGENAVIGFSDIDDWENTLELVKRLRFNERGDLP